MPLDTLEHIQDALQRAIELEHATLPPYLTALYSLVPGKNLEISDILNGIVIQEMQHMALAANILNAIGGKPNIANYDFVPRYPGGLPFHIGDRNGVRFDVPLRGFSLELVPDVFMRIEEPDLPLIFPVAKPLRAVDEPDFQTIGDFYRNLRSELQAPWFSGDMSRQLSGFVAPVTSLASAQAAIDTIVAQGEGSTKLPTDGEGAELAHYYRFEQIVKGKFLVPDTSVPQGFSFSGAPIPFDAKAVLPIVENAHSSLYTPGSQVRFESDLFNDIYSNLLRSLQATLSGDPGGLKIAIGLMFDLKLQAIKLINMPLGPGINAAPCFEFSG
jgi:hypothetical protein